MLENLKSQLKERFPINFENFVFKKEVPVHRSQWLYFLGGLTLFCFIIQLITGLLLLPYYEPTIITANQSIEYITRYVPFGYLIRNIHAWSSSFMIFFAVIHLLSVFATKSYVKPRELTWLTGVLLLLITLGFGFTGYLLPWHQIAVNATKVGMEIVQSSTSFLPGIFKLPGEFFATNLRGGPAITQTTLSRFFVIHVVILPFIFFGLIMIHLFMVQLHGLNKEGFNVVRIEKFFPDFLIKDLVAWLILFLILLIIAQTMPYDSFLPYPLKEGYIDNSPTPSGIKPEWYFLFLYYPLELFPKTLIIIISFLFFLAMLFTPLIFKTLAKTIHRIIAAGIFIYLFVVTIWGGDIINIFRQ